MNITGSEEHGYWCTSSQVSGGECDCPRKGRAVTAEAHEAALKQMRTLAHTAGWDAAMAYLRVSPEDQLKALIHSQAVHAEEADHHQLEETAMRTHVWDIKAGSTIHITGVSGALEVVAMEYTDAGSVTTLTLRPRGDER